MKSELQIVVFFCCIEGNNLIAEGCLHTHKEGVWVLPCTLHKICNCSCTPGNIKSSSQHLLAYFILFMHYGMNSFNWCWNLPTPWNNNYFMASLLTCCPKLDRNLVNLVVLPSSNFFRMLMWDYFKPSATINPSAFLFRILNVWVVRVNMGSLVSGS